MGVLRDGERVRVDGGAGVVVRLGPARKSPFRGASGAGKTARKDP
jgi:hypothetical protein